MTQKVLIYGGTESRVGLSKRTHPALNLRQVQPKHRFPTRSLLKFKQPATRPFQQKCRRTFATP